MDMRILAEIALIWLLLGLLVALLLSAAIRAGRHRC